MPSKCTIYVRDGVIIVIDEIISDEIVNLDPGMEDWLDELTSWTRPNSLDEE